MEKICKKIGVGITTYNRFEYYKKCLASIPRNEIDELVIVNDGTDHYAKSGDGDVVIHNDKQLGVSKSKNKAILELIKRDVEHIFLIEDDILIKDTSVFQQYIKAAQSTGIHHLCFEKIAGNEQTLKFVLEQSDGVKIGFYHNPQGAFMYINSSLVKKLGYFDEQYTNAFEHVDFAYNLTRKGVAPCFWFFPDILDSEKYLTDIEGSNENSSITNKPMYKENVAKSTEYFIKKWGHFTIDVPEPTPQQLHESLIHLQTNYSRKKLVNKGKKLSIIIPYRDRETARRLLLPKLKEYVSKQVENFEIIVVTQENEKPFNKGLLNNIGFAASSKDSDYVCFHDVDLLPEFADYSYPALPTHMSSHCSQFNYVNIPDKIMGGVVLFTNEHYKKVNGYSNEFNGWGKEDDDLYARCEKESLKPYKSPYGRFYSVPHQHRLTNQVENELHLKNGDRFRAFVDGKLGKNYHKKDGLSNCFEKIDNFSEEIKDGVKYINVKF